MTTTRLPDQKPGSGEADAIGTGYPEPRRYRWARECCGFSGRGSPETVIRPPHRWSWPAAAELWEHTELLYFLTKRELQIRYKQSLFGVGWAVFQPLVLAFIFALVFGQLVKLPSEGLPYRGLRGGGAGAVAVHLAGDPAGATSLVLDANLISKVYFPRLALPLAKALSLVFDLIYRLLRGDRDRPDLRSPDLGQRLDRVPLSCCSESLRPSPWAPCSQRSTSSTATSNWSCRWSSR